MVTRYAMDWYGKVSGDGAIEENPNGPYVLFADYATLLAENDQLRRELDAIRNKTLEEAAKVVERGKGIYVNGHPDIVKSLFAAAKAIRALKEPSDE